MIHLRAMTAVTGVALFGLLAGCSGSDASAGGASATPAPTASASPTPSPPPTSTPTPAPTSTAVNASLADLKVDQTFPTISTTLKVERIIARGSFAPATSVAPTAGSLLSFAASGPSFTYRLQDLTYPIDPANPSSKTEYAALFGPSQLNRDPALTNARFTTYTSVLGSSLTLRQFNAGSGNDLLALNYAGMGMVEVNHDLAPGVQQERRPYAFFSQVTPTAALPAATAVYNGAIYGFASPKNGVSPSTTTPFGQAYIISGTLRLTVDFSARTYTGTLTVNGVSDQSTTTSVSLGDISLGTGTIANSSFSGSLNDGALLGSFAGPGAQELDGTLRLSLLDPRQNSIPLSLVAAFVAKR